MTSRSALRRLWYSLDRSVPAPDKFPPSGTVQDGRTLAELRDIPCLVLLGAPGMGKSHEAAAEYNALTLQGDAVELIEAQRLQSSQSFLSDMFRSPAAMAWRGGSARWTLLIDGVDECSGGAAAFGRQLSFLLERLVTYGTLNDFRLRLFCRTVEWNDALDGILSQTWPDQDRQTFQLAPLTEADILAMAEDDLGTKAGAHDFVNSLKDRHLESLAARPVSYRMLINLFRQHQILPRGQADLFLQGIRSLLFDHRADLHFTPDGNLGPITTITSARLEPDKLTILAGRIALAMALSDHSVLSTEKGSSSALFVGDLAFGSEPSPPYSFQVRAPDLLDVVRSPLFLSVGRGHYTFAHKTFLEFLAARYLVDHELEPCRLLEFLTVTDPDGRGAGIAPQFREIAAWAATLSTPIFRDLVDREPDILLQSDVASFEHDLRKRLVSAIVQRAETDYLYSRYWQVRENFSRLRHIGLAEQLRSIIFDPARSDAARLCALDILEETRTSGFTAELVALAANAELEPALRRAAAGAAASLADENEKPLLLSLLDQTGAGQDDEIRGAVLAATWPGALGISELLSALTPPQEPNTIGSYAMFLYRLEPGQLSTSDALAIVRWLKASLSGSGFEESDAHSDRGIRRKFFRAAAKQMEAPEVLEAIAELVTHAIDRGYVSWLFESDLNDDAWAGTAEARVELASRVLNSANDPVVTARLFRHYARPLIVEDDWKNFAKRIAVTPEGSVKTALAELMVWLPRDDMFHQLGELWSLSESDTTVRSAWLARFSVDLASPAVAWMREAERRRSKVDARSEESTAHRERSDNAVRGLLEEINDDPTLWWRINLHLFVSDSGQYRGELEFSSDLTKTPGWDRLRDGATAQLLDAARQYLERAHLDSRRWIGTNTHHRPAAAAYRAFRLLFEHRRDAFDALSSDVWRKWAPALLCFFENSPGESINIQRTIVAHAYAAAPQGIFQTLARLARGPRSEGLDNRILEVLDDAFDSELGAFLRRLQRGRLRGIGTEERIAKYLVRKNYLPAIDDVTTDLVRRVGSESSRPLSDGYADVVAQLLADGNENIWTLVIALRNIDPESVRTIWNAFASTFAFSLVPGLGLVSADTIAESYLALDELYPERLPATAEARFLTTADYVQRLRSVLVGHLVQRSNAAALNALERLAVSAVDGSNIRFHIQEARQLLRSTNSGQDPLQVLERIAILSPEYPEKSAVAVATERLAVAQIIPDEPTVPSEPDTIIAPATKPTSTPLKFLVVATEWQSSNGGISTLNREFCVALAAQGHSVQCLVLDATSSESAHANSHNVQLISCPSATGIRGKERFLLAEQSKLGAAPDIVIGHDHVSGPYALRWADLFGRKYVHVLHTVPEEIEPLKGRTREHPDGFFRGSVKRDDQNELCRRASLVVGIGPRIYNAIPPAAASPYLMLPGLNEKLMGTNPTRRHRAECLITGRMEDGDLKGLQIAANAILKLRTNRISTSEPEAPLLVVRGFDLHHGDDELAKHCGLKVGEHRGWLLPRPYSTEAQHTQDDLRTSSLVLMPSLAEGFGLTGYEAIAAGVPVLLTENSGLAEMLKSFEASGQIAAGFVDRHIVLGGNDIDALAARWAEKIKALHMDRDAAFTRADAIRAQLRPTLSWSSAASAFVRRVKELG